MKLSVRRTPWGLALVSEAGEILPMQRSLVIKSVPDDLVTVTVEFVVGENLIIDVDTEESADG
ncbi:hypothetical protein ACLE20_15205 [Rhizobium sp. YIM 134829]|uniref:hypothetical protein n=1 Tax=Rhizobium sp. YIM 134829 TaxID=3390453 RepID=UPI00397D035E